MTNTLALVKKEQPRKPEESELQYLDRVRADTYWKLHAKKKRTKGEEKEYKSVESKLIGHASINSPQFPVYHADSAMKPGVERIYDELVDQFGCETPQKRILIQRLTYAWNQALSYEFMFSVCKYKKREEGGYTFEYTSDKTRYLGELRKGIESANDQIIRLTQALQHISAPPIQVKVKNAVIAQNMQINQGAAPKDFDKFPSTENNAKTPS
jgi:hypothetical protein